jgi:hypothetical protein
MICATHSPPLEPGGLLILHVVAGTHPKKRLQLSVKDCHLHIRIVQRTIGTNRFLVHCPGPGAVEASGANRLPGGSKEHD